MELVDMKKQLFNLLNEIKDEVEPRVPMWVMTSSIYPEIKKVLFSVSYKKMEILGYCDTRNPFRQKIFIDSKHKHQRLAIFLHEAEHIRLGHGWHLNSLGSNAKLRRQILAEVNVHWNLLNRLEGEELMQYKSIFTDPKVFYFPELLNVKSKKEMTRLLSPVLKETYSKKGKKK
jgi:hypothetical protein